MKHIEDILQSLFVMASMVEARDPYTGGHLWRVAQFSRLLAEQVGLSNETVARVAAGGFLHDLGKISIADHILGKPGPLTDEEYTVIKTHPEVGSRLLSGHPLAELVVASVLSHHETPDGRGYPHQLAGEGVPVEARIVGVCDAFDAMTSNRPYRRGMPVSRALDIIEEHLETQFDAVFGRVFVKLGREGLLDHIIGHSEAGIPVMDCPVCGPTIVVTRKHKSGDHLFCRNCGGEGVVDRDEQGTQLHFTGRQGSASDLEPQIDLDVIGELVKSAARNLEAQTDLERA